MENKNFKEYLPQIIWTISIVFEIILASVLVYMDKLPTKYLVVILIILVLFGFLTATLLLTWDASREKISFKRILGIILSAVIAVVSIVGSVAGLRVESTIDTIVSSDDEVAAVIGVYVMADDTSENIADMGGYLFGQLEAYDEKRNEAAVSQIEKETGGSIRTEMAESAMSLVAGLYDHDFGAIIIDEGYVSLVTESMDDEVESPYAEFDADTHLVYEIPIYKTEQEIAEEETKSLDRKDITKDTFIVYVSGSDTRSTKLTTSRSDVNILAEINPVTHEIFLLSTPRDYYVENPAGGGAKDKLTHCGIYGVENSMEALEKLYGVDIDYYVQVNFSGFERLIDSLGGITVISQYNFTSYRYGGTFSFQKGENYVGGKEALAFARDRFEVPGGDVTRGIHQMAVIQGVVNKVSSDPAVLSKYADILSSLEGMFATSLSNEDISSLARMQLDENPSWSVHSFSVNGSGGKESNYSMPGVRSYVMYVDDAMVAFAKDLLQKVADGEILTDEDMVYGSAE